MKIRIKRSFKYETRSAFGSEVPNFVLTHKDTLQVEVDGAWVNVPVEEEEEPLHPNEVSRRRYMEGLNNLKQFIEDTGARPKTGETGGVGERVSSVRVSVGEPTNKLSQD